MDNAQLEAFLTAQSKKQGGGGVSAEQAAALSRFWKSQRVRVRERLLAQSRWEPSLRGLSWRVDLQAASRQRDTEHGGPVALMELELSRTGQVSYKVRQEGILGTKNISISSWKSTTYEHFCCVLSPHCF